LFEFLKLGRYLGYYSWDYGVLKEVMVEIQGVSGRKVNILGGDSMDYSE